MPIIKKIKRVKRAANNKQNNEQQNERNTKNKKLSRLLGFKIISKRTELFAIIDEQKKAKERDLANFVLSRFNENIE